MCTQCALHKPPTSGLAQKEHQIGLLISPIREDSQKVTECHSANGKKMARGNGDNLLAIKHKKRSDTKIEGSRATHPRAVLHVGLERARLTVPYCTTENGSKYTLTIECSQSIDQSFLAHRRTPLDLARKVMTARHRKTAQWPPRLTIR